MAIEAAHEATSSAQVERIEDIMNFAMEKLTLYRDIKSKAETLRVLRSGKILGKVAGKEVGKPRILDRKAVKIGKKKAEECRVNEAVKKEAAAQRKIRAAERKKIQLEKKEQKAQQVHTSKK